MSLWRSSLFALLLLLCLAVVAWLAPSDILELGPIEIRLPQLREALSTPERANFDVESRLTEVEQQMQFRQDSLREAITDSLQFYRHFFRSSEASLVYPDSDYTYLAPFFHALERADTAAVHVLHFGDSQIEGDRITHLLRDSLQDLFGGSGPGLLPLWQPIPARSVAQQLSDSVPTYFAGGMMGRRAPNPRYGCLAQVSHLKGDSVMFRLNARETAGFQRLVLYAGRVDSLTAVCDGQRRTLRRGPGLQRAVWIPRSDRHLALSLDGAAEIYGLEVDAGHGTTVSNIPLRGSDGLFFMRMDQQLASAMCRDLNVKLILLEFGGNALPMLDDTATVRRYCEALGQQIGRIHEVLPDMRVVLIGPADMSVKIDGELQTHPLLPDLVREMQAMAQQRGVAFWNMYAVMGGRNSMLAWAAHQPAWAAPDYIHFTVRGAKKIAAVLWRALRLNYDYLRLLARLDEVPDTAAH